VPCRAGDLTLASAVKLGIRPEHIRVTENGAGDARLSVSMTEQLGGESYLHGTLASSETLSVRLPGQTRVTRGETVGVALGDPETRHCFRADTGAVLPPLT
jgi:multiple sugar transport system ATP-binding protein